jgi:hypothetical protein
VDGQDLDEHGAVATAATLRPRVLGGRRSCASRALGQAQGRRHPQRHRSSQAGHAQHRLRCRLTVHAAELSTLHDVDPGSNASRIRLAIRNGLMVQASHLTWLTSGSS